MEVGQVVFSKCGRDKGRAFVILAVEGEYVFLADGQLRPLDKLKKKKARHTQHTNVILEMTGTGKIFGRSEGAAFSEGKRADLGGMTDADIRKWLLPFKRR